MRILSVSVVLLSLSAVPAFSQNAMLASNPASEPSVIGSVTAPIISKAPVPAATEPSDIANLDLTSLRETVAQKNKALSTQVTAEKAVVHKNEALLKDAKKIDAANKKLEAERKQLDAQNAALDKERQAMQAGQGSSQVATNVHPVN